MQISLPEKCVQNQYHKMRFEGDISIDIKLKKAAAKYARDLGMTGKIQVIKRKNSYIVSSI